MGHLYLKSSVFYHRLVNLKQVATVTFFTAVCLTLLAITPAKLASKSGQTSAVGGPTLVTQTNSTRAIALESVSMRTEPFAPVTTLPFSTDSRTRIMLFATNLTLLPGEDTTAVTADAEDGARIRYPLSVEYVGVVAGFPWMTSIVMRLNNNMGDIGDVLVGVTLRGTTSNRVRVGIGHIGGGPPDDISPVPDL